MSEAIDQRKKDSFTHVPKTWAVVAEGQRETQEMEGGSKGKDQDNVHNKEDEQTSDFISRTREDFLDNVNIFAFFV